MADATPSSRQNASKMFLNLEQNLAMLEQSLKRSSFAKDQMIAVLDRFEDRFKKLETEMMSMNERIDILKLTHDNIDGTIRSIDNVLTKFDVPKVVEKRISQGINDDLDSFLQCLDQISEASSFLTANSGFRGAQKISNHLAELKQKAQSLLEAEFRRILTQSSIEIDPFHLPRPLEDGFELIPSNVLDQLNKIAQRLHTMNSIGYRKIYKDIRSNIVRQSLNKIYPEKEKKKKGQDQEGSLSKRFYVKGSHKFIFYMNFYLKYLEAERAITAKMIFGPQRDSIFGEIVSPSLKLFVEKAQDLAQKKLTSEKVFVILDVLENLNKIIQSFDKVLGDNSVLTRDMQGLASSLKDSAHDLLQGYITEITHNAAEVFADGLVHEVTSNAFTFMKRLFEYRYTTEYVLCTDETAKELAEIAATETANSYYTPSPSSNNAVEASTSFGSSPTMSPDVKKSILSGVTLDSTAKTNSSIVSGSLANSWLGKYLRQLLKAVEDNLELKSRQYKQRSLAAIFLLNNYYYSMKKLQSPEFEPYVVVPITQNVLKNVKRQETEYITASWQKALSYLNVRETESKLSIRNGEYSRSSKNEIKNRLSHFNQIFEELYHTHRVYAIPDIELREHMRTLTIETVIPIYKQFVTKYEKTKFSKQPSKYILYDFSILEDMLNLLFDDSKR